MNTPKQTNIDAERPWPIDHEWGDNGKTIIINNNNDKERNAKDVRTQNEMGYYMLNIHDKTKSNFEKRSISMWFKIYR